MHMHSSVLFCTLFVIYCGKCLLLFIDKLIAHVADGEQDPLSQIDRGTSWRGIASFMMRGQMSLGRIWPSFRGFKDFFGA